jgi:Tc toxin complex TcA C-terminal TcB-binding domain/FG-GAP-like repeat
MFLVRFVTMAYADQTVTLRDPVDGWDVDVPGAYEDGAWQFQLDETHYPEQFRFKFVLDGPVYMDGYDQELKPAAGAVYEYDEAAVRFCFYVRFRPGVPADREVTLRTSVDGWDTDLPGEFADDAWWFRLDAARYRPGFEFRFVGGRSSLIGDREWLLPVPGGDYTFSEIAPPRPVIGADAQTRGRLTMAGLSLPQDVAATTAERLAGVLGDSDLASRVHAAASAQAAVLDALATGDRLDGSRDAQPSPAGTAAECGCEDCRAATSPMAFLADLVGYAAARGGSADRPESIGQLLRQPLADLPIDCTTAEEQVAQVRLCIESLERLLADERRSRPDVGCVPEPQGISFVVAADVDGDGQQELIVVFPDLWARDIFGSDRDGLWVMRYDSAAGRWRHLRPGPDPNGAALLLPPGVRASYGFAATLRADARPGQRDRQQVVLAVEQDGQASTRFWVLQYEPDAASFEASWSHVRPASFNAVGADLVVDVPGVRGAFAADVDGDGWDEVVAYGEAPPPAPGDPGRPNAFWVYHLDGSDWVSLAAPGSPNDVAFNCSDPQRGQYPVRTATAGDLDQDGRAEIIAVPDATGSEGTLVWTMHYGGAPGQWSHMVSEPGVLRPLDADLSVWPAPWPIERILVGRVTPGNPQPALLAAPEQMITFGGSDPARFSVWRYQPASGAAAATFVEAGTAACSDQPLSLDAALLADIDGDSQGELIAMTHTGRNIWRSAAWVMDSDAAGAWRHLSPVPGHPFGADLEWFPGADVRAFSAVAADIDGDGRDELVFAGSYSSDLWVLGYQDGGWQHRTPVLPDTIAARYGFAAYQGLLLRLGTSYDEVRQARSATAADRQALAVRLGLALGGTRPDILDVLLLSPDTADMETLERQFGLAATRRDPLSQGPAEGTGAQQVQRWRLHGARWSADPVSASTSPDGQVYLSLEQPGPGRVFVRAYRDAARSSLVAMGEGDPAAPVRLYDFDGSGLTGTVELDFREQTTDITLRVFPEVTVARWARLRELWDAEDIPGDPYRPTTAGAGGEPAPPMIHPALIGPDDFRLPLAKAAAGAADAAFDLWLRRRSWLDGIMARLRGFGGDLPALLGWMRGGDPAETHPWSGAPADLDALAAQLSQGSPDDVRAAATTVRDLLFLPPGAFLRLTGLRTGLAAAPLSPPEWGEICAILALAHLRSQYSSWRQQERDAGIRLDAASFTTGGPPAAAGPWPPEPAEIPGGPAPLVDPDLLALDGIPRSMAGDEARALWHRRTAELRENTRVVRAARTGGWEQQLAAGLGTVPAGAASWAAWITERAADLDNLDPAMAAAAETAIAERLGGMRPAAFRRLAAVNEAVAETLTPTEGARADAERLLAAARKVIVLYPGWRSEENTATRPLPYWRARRLTLTLWLATAEERRAWQTGLAARSQVPVVDPDRVTLGQIITGASSAAVSAAEQLRATREGQLASRQQTLTATLTDTARPDPLARLDATLLAALWTDAEQAAVRADLRARRQAAGLPSELIAQLFPADADRFGVLRAALDTGGPAAVDARRAMIGLGFSSEAGFRALGDTLRRLPSTVSQGEWNRFDAILTAAALIGWLVHAEQDADRLGMRIADRLAPLRLSLPAWRRLLAIRNTAAAGGPILDDETSEVISILLRSEKERLFGAWQQAEQDVPAGQRVRLGPDSFTLPDSDGTMAEPASWRVTAAEQRRWRQMLRSRAEQHQQVLATLADAVMQVEQDTLPGYRDDLLAALPAPSDLPDGGARWAEGHLLVDTADSGTRRTTRVGHAIDTVLALLWSARTGQLRDSYPALVLTAPTFDEDWRWIGSYATWRSAMLAHLYPENLLRPSLRRYQSPALQNVLEQLRAARQLSPQQARRIAAGYAGYFADICRLDLNPDRVVCADVTGLAYTPVMLAGGTGQPRSCTVYAAISPNSRRVYWTLRDRSTIAAGTGYEVGFWQPLTQFGDGEVTELLGMTQYAPPRDPAGRRWVYLFALQRTLDGMSLVFLRLDVATAQWDGEPRPLPPPAGAAEFSAWLVPTTADQPPRLGFEFTGAAGGRPAGSRVTRSLNARGTNWERTEFTVLTADGQWQPLAPGTVDLPSVTTIRTVLTGDFDGNGIDEVMVVAGTNNFARPLRLGANSRPLAMANLQLPDNALTTSGRFTKTSLTESHDEVVSLVPVDNSVAQRHRFLLETNEWTLGNESEAWRIPDADDPPHLLVAVGALVAGDFDGRGVASAAVCASTSTQSNVRGAAVWILEAAARGLKPVPVDRNRVDPQHEYRDKGGDGDANKRHDDLNFGITFRPCPAVAGLHVPVGLAVAGDFDGDGCDELAMIPAPVPDPSDGSGASDDISRGNDVWVWDLHPTLGWRPLGNVDRTGRLRISYDLSSDPFALLNAAAGDFDGDGRDELALIPDLRAPGTPNIIRILDFQTEPWSDDPAIGTWRELPPLDLSAATSGARFAAAVDLDGDGRDELVVVGNGWLRIWELDPLTNAWAPFPLDGSGLGAAAAAVAAGNLDEPHPFSDFRQPRRGARVRNLPEQLLVFGGTTLVQEPPRTGNNLQRTLTREPAPPHLARRFNVLGRRHAPCDPGWVTPRYSGFAGWVLDDTIQQRLQAARSRTALGDNANAPATVRRYLEEAFYDLPLAIALALQESHDYAHALDWFRLVYDYSQPQAARKVFFGLVLDEQGADQHAAANPASYARRLLDWVRDPLDPHATAALRPHSYTRGTLQPLIRCLLDYADTEFTQDTPESLERARILYQTAHDLLDEPVLRQHLGECADVIVRIPAASPDPQLAPAIRTLQTRLGTVPDPAVAASAAARIAGTLDGETDRSAADRVTAAERVAATALASIPPPIRLGAALDPPSSGSPQLRPARLDDATFTPVLAALTAALDSVPPPHAITAPSQAFCVSPNPALASLRLHAELNLFKIRTGRNIAGLRRAVEAYSAPASQTPGLPMIGADGQLAPPALRTAAPTPYRYQTLIEQARQLAGQAREHEAMMLTALEKADAASLDLLRARQDVQVTRAGVQLQEVRVTQARDQVTLAQLQLERATFDQHRFRDLLAAGPNQYERDALGLLQVTMAQHGAAAAASMVASTIQGSASAVNWLWGGDPSGAAAGAMSAMAQAFSSGAALTSTWSQWNSLQAGYARTQQDWQYRQQLAAYDQSIAGQQITISTDGVRVAEQERRVSELQADTAEQLLDFQQTRFANLELYDWMAGVLDRTYRWFLQQATSAAQLAAQQLAFERQQGQPPAIQADYWEPPQRLAAPTGAPPGPDRRGLTGAERLIQDIAQLEQYAFQTDQRKLQLTRVLSLAQLDPLALAQLQADGTTTFASPMRLFDQDFPGHYLRLIRRVTVSVIALIAPSEGIHATLSTTGVSQVAVGPDPVQTVGMHRLPESVGLSAPINATGIFTFEPPAGMRDPFEGLGVDTTWQFDLPKAANLFDFSTIADVLVTIDYTALDSPDYRLRVLRELDQAREGQRGFSLRQEFADAWWDLNNPGQIDTPMQVSFTTRQTDFPPNLDQITIDHIAVSLVCDSSPPAPLSTITLRLTEDGTTARLGGPAQLVDRAVSTRRANGGPWLSITGKSPTGRWELGLPDTDEIRDWLTAEQLLDALIIVSYRATTF